MESVMKFNVYILAASLLVTFASLAYLSLHERKSLVPINPVLLAPNGMSQEFVLPSQPPNAGQVLQCNRVYGDVYNCAWFTVPIPASKPKDSRDKR